MRHVLAAKQHSLLAAFASSNTLVAFDYDGTLAPIVDDPAGAGMRPRTRRLLARVAARYPTAIISGRGLRDLKATVGALRLAHLSGNHGIEPWGDRRAYAARVRAWMPHLTRRLAAADGIAVEEKRYSVTVHYRQARRKRRALRLIEEAARALRGARVFGGEYVVNIVPAGAPDKGVALERACARLGCDAAIYVGDDETDEHVFAAASDRPLLGVRVGRRRASRAPYFLARQDEIDAFLETLLRLRPARGRVGHTAARRPRQRRRVV
jgi:trehalose 6-phosphate phosphatase